MAQIYVFVILGMLLLGGAYIIYLRDKYQKAVIGHVWATFRTKTRSRIDGLCEVKGNKVIPPRRLISNDPDPTIYIVNSTVTDNFSYPPLFPHFLQATVPSAVFDEGDPEPHGRRNDPPILTEKLLFNLVNEASTAITMRGLNTELRQDDIMEAMKAAGGGSKTQLLISIVIIVGLIILGIFVFKISGQMSNLAALYGL